MEDVEGVFFQHAICESVFTGAGSPFCDFLRPVPRFIHLVDFQLGAGKDFTIQALLAAGFGVVLDVVPLGNGDHRLFVLDGERQCSVLTAILHNDCGWHQISRSIVTLHIGDFVVGIHLKGHHGHRCFGAVPCPGHVTVRSIRRLGLHQDIGAFLGDVGRGISDGTIRQITRTKTQLTLIIGQAVIGRCIKAALCSIIDGGVGQRELRAGEHLFILTVHLFQKKLFRLFGNRSILHGGEMLFFLGNGTV